MCHEGFRIAFTILSFQSGLLGSCNLEQQWMDRRNHLMKNTVYADDMSIVFYGLVTIGVFSVAE